MIFAKLSEMIRQPETNDEKIAFDHVPFVAGTVGGGPDLP
jgi:hypothetical protein